MANALIATTIFLGVLMIVGATYHQIANVSFWRLAAKLPEQAYHWISNDSAWMIVEGAPPNPRLEFVGPYYLAVPRLGRKVTLYVRPDQMKDSQRRFVAQYAEQIPARSFPVLGIFALLVPITIMLWMPKPLAPVKLILGDGFATLGYLLGAASIVPGHFRILGLDDRFRTLIAGAIALGLGLFLSVVSLGIFD